MSRYFLRDRRSHVHQPYPAWRTLRYLALFASLGKFPQRSSYIFTKPPCGYLDLLFPRDKQPVNTKMQLQWMISPFDHTVLTSLNTKSRAACLTAVRQKGVEDHSHPRGNLTSSYIAPQPGVETTPRHNVILLG